MSLNEPEILHVSDTALLVGACRALETARPDGLIRDPFASLLVGERGMAIAGAFAGLEIMCFGIAMRTLLLDELVVHAVAEHRVETVLSLGCGLDARPWRLRLPASLRWIEVDLPPLLEYKSSRLAEAAPHCRLERVAADITDPVQRQAVLAGVGAGPAMVITEGLLMYLPSNSVEALAVDLVRAGVRHWLLDITSRAFAARNSMGSYQAIENVRAAGHLDGEQILDVLRGNGWRAEAHYSYSQAARTRVPASRIQELTRSIPSGERPPSLPDGDPTGVHFLVSAGCCAG